MTAPASSRSFALTDSILFTGESFVERHALLAQDGRVLDLVPMDKIPADFEVFSCAGQILAPGFIDCQVNGGGNVLVNDNPTAESLMAVAASHRKTGTTRLLPTVVTDRPEITRQAIEAAHAAQKQDRSLIGIHIEGPHISPAFDGIHSASLIRPMTAADMELYALKPSPLEGEEAPIHLLTVAPEQVPPEQIKALTARGVIVSIGHTAATPEQIRAALAAGATGFTHLYNRMGTLSAREPNCAGVALDDRESWCGMIADRFHVAPEMIRLALRAKPENKLFFVSDAMAPAGADTPLPFALYGEAIYPSTDVCKNGQGRVAGSMMTLGEITSHAICDLKLAPERALRMASTIPAAFLGLERRLGKLLPGYEADIVALDHFFKAQAVWRAGALMTAKGG